MMIIRNVELCMYMYCHESCHVICIMNNPMFRQPVTVIALMVAEQSCALVGFERFVIWLSLQKDQAKRKCESFRGSQGVKETLSGKSEQRFRVEESKDHVWARRGVNHDLIPKGIDVTKVPHALH